ncbi:hypothetical protein BKG58_19715 [Mycobacteroides abscessus subsp. abscessus]|uniref:hypothetical protein n=1 Tax=Mycobacteroides abscessus TaxID=36809 RepID=UPI000349CF99|nr:hypothetical protein [Mycobacteroides abscessus]OLT79659.1 hypothetical protein BKG58_19715 [Mycobacteroides abscessus subsp. abscessus]SHP93819.1 Uncharacterised protein [Mycobacteroides abscessus subsp. abscessus]SKO06368.1 Uncharacterised protein [Mycobacteroides abscessus subsp. abscessus]
MTKQQHLKRQARELRRANPGIRLADAMHALTPQDVAARAPWSVGSSPWIREASDPCSCLFCGQDTAILSFTDMAEDNGRVQIYCDSGNCDAREVEIIVTEDGTEATRTRTDVRILRHFPPDKPRNFWNGAGSAWSAGTAPAARSGNVAVKCVFCGEQTCTLSRNDVAADTGRMRIHCRNARCSMKEAEALLKRDGYGFQSDRAVMKALAALFISRADQLSADLPPGAFRAFPVSDWATPADGVDPLQMRISGPVPWEE